MMQGECYVYSHKNNSHRLGKCDKDDGVCSVCDVVVAAADIRRSSKKMRID